MNRASRIEPLFVGDDLAGFDIPPEQPQVHGPAKAGNAIVLVGLGPSRMPESYLGDALPLGQVKADAGPHPILRRAGHFQLKLFVRLASRDNRAPVVFRTKPEFVLRALARLAR